MRDDSQLAEKKKSYQAAINLLGELEPLELEAGLYQEGYLEFEGEFREYQNICQRLKGLGYSTDDARKIEGYFQREWKHLEEEKRQILKEKRIAGRLLEKVYSRERSREESKHEIRGKGL